MTQTAMKNKTLINKGLQVFLKLVVPLLTTSIEERQLFAKGAATYLDRLSHIETYQGPRTMLKQAKACRNTVLQYLGGSPVLSASERISLDKSGLPSMIGPLKILLKRADKNPRLIAGVLTILYVTRIVTLPVKADYEPITKEYSGQEVAKLSSEIEIVMTRFKLTSLKVPSWVACHLSVRKGPSGEPAMASSLAELSQIKKDPQFLEDLLTLGGKRFNTYLQPLLERVKDFGPTTLRKVSVISDREGKSRIIGILDYWSQTVLKPFHDHTMKLLHQFEPMDATWDQGRFTKRDIPAGPYYSYDLSNATDRFPIAFQRIVVEKIYNPDIAAAWERLLTRLEFASKDGPVVFATGQPLGAYSSWSVFSLSHHICVGIAALRCGKELPFTGYYLLGDDIMIADSDVAMEYRKLMSELGVEISTLKTVQSDHFFNFASRFFYKDQEVSPFTLTGLQEGIRSAPTLASFLQTMIEHGWQELLGPILAPGTVENITRIYSHQPQTRLANMTRLLIRFPLNGILGVLAASDEALTDQFNRSCFEKHNRELLRDYTLLAIRSNLINNLPTLYKAFEDWQKNFPPIDDYFIPESELEPFEHALKRNSAPWVNTWDYQHRQTLLMLTTLRTTMLGEVPGLPVPPTKLEDWVPFYRQISILPNVEKIFKSRNHVTIVNANATIIRDVLRTSKKYSLLELYHQVPNPFLEDDESSEDPE